MSNKRRHRDESPDLFSAAGMPEHVPAVAGNIKPATRATKHAGKVAEKAPASVHDDHPLDERYLRDTLVAERYGICRQTVWRWVKLGKLPAPVALSEGSTRWRLSDLVAHDASIRGRAMDKARRSSGMPASKAGMRT